MPWARLDDGFWSNPKIRAISGDAAKLYVVALSYVSHEMTDGLVDDDMVHGLCMMHRLRDPQPIVQELCNQVLWEPCDQGYMIHDYLIYNRDRLSWERDRSHNAARQKDWRSNAVTNVESDVTNAVTNVVHNTDPVPVPVPMIMSAGGRSITSAPSAPSKKTKQFDPESPSYRLTGVLCEELLARDPRTRVPASGSQQYQNWCRWIDKLIKSGRTGDEISAVIRWSQHDSFWSSNILSTSGLYNNFDKLSRKMQSNGAPRWRQPTHPAVDAEWRAEFLNGIKEQQAEVSHETDP